MQDTLHRLDHDVDAWVATADPGGGTPYLVPLSFLWDGATLLVATPAASPTSRNLRATGRVRLGIGPTRDLVLVEGHRARRRPPATSPAGVGDAFAAKTGFDPRRLSARLHRTSASTRGACRPGREANELADRDLMRQGDWVI